MRMSTTSRNQKGWTGVITGNVNRWPELSRRRTRPFRGARRLGDACDPHRGPDVVDAQERRSLEHAERRRGEARGHAALGRPLVAREAGEEALPRRADEHGPA